MKNSSGIGPSQVGWSPALAPQAPGREVKAEKSLAIVGSGDLAWRLRLRLSRNIPRARLLDPDKAQWKSIFAAKSFDRVVYLAEATRQGGPDLAQARSLLEACRGPSVHLVLVSSAAIYHPNPSHPGHVSESFSLQRRRSNPIAQGWRQLEAIAREISPDFASLVVLRAAPVITASGEDYFSRLFQARTAAVLPGYDPPLQFLSLADLERAIQAVMRQGLSGFHLYNLAPSDVIPLRRALRCSGTTSLPIPRFLQRPVRRVLSALGIGHPQGQLDYIRHPWTVAADRIQRELHFRPKDGSWAALQSAFGGALGLQSPGRRYDEFGMDCGAIDRWSRGVLKFLYRYYWRVEVSGLENVPTRGRALLVGMHRGFMPLDAVMVVHLLAGRCYRYPRFLVHPGLLEFPFIFNFITKMGGLLACRRNAERILRQGGLLGVFPEGVRGAFTPYREAYKLQRFSNEFARLALRERAPIVPFVIVGSAEVFPILGRIKSAWWRRKALWPFIPLTPTFPLVPLPLPSKWHIRFLPPLSFMDHRAQAEDPGFIREIVGEVRRQMEEAVDCMLKRRPSIFYGSVFQTREGREPARVFRKTHHEDTKNPRRFE